MATPPAGCPEPGHADRRTRKRGTVAVAGAPRQRWECLHSAGDRHYFTTAPTRTPQVRCPRPGHADARVVRKGSRTKNGQTWQRFRCTRPTGEAHITHPRLARPAGRVNPNPYLPS